MAKLEKQEACQLYIEQEIESGLADGKSKYAVGQEIAVWLKKMFNADVKPNTITIKAHRLEKKLVTNVTNNIPLANEEQKIIVKKANEIKKVKTCIKSVVGKYDVIVIDPPWAMKKIVREVRPNQTEELDYQTMSLEEIQNIKIPYNDNCHVFLWTTHKFLPHSFNCLIEWGLKYTCCFVWHKNGGFQVTGLPQYNNEFCLYARRGSPYFIDTKAFFTCFNANRGKHSEKPEEFYHILRRVTEGKRLDMFNRRKIEGFDGFGLEAK